MKWFVDHSLRVYRTVPDCADWAFERREDGHLTIAAGRFVFTTIPGGRGTISKAELRERKREWKRARQLNK